MIDSNDIVYAENLRSLRLDSKLKQYTIALALDLKNQQEYSNYENGKRHFTGEFIRKVCDYFKISEQKFKAAKKSEDPGLKTNENLLVESNTLALNASQTEMAWQVVLLNYKKLLIEDELEIVKLKMEKLSKGRSKSKTRVNINVKI